MLLLFYILIEITDPKTQNAKRIFQFSATAYNDKKNHKHVVQKTLKRTNLMPFFINAIIFFRKEN